MILRKLFTFLFFLLIGISSYSQHKVLFIVGDTVNLNLENARGNTQWQVSSDSLNWLNIPGQTGSTLPATIALSGKWVRPVIEELNCPPYIGINSLILAVDTAANGFISEDFSLINLPWSFVSSNNSGVLNFNGNYTSVIQPGDHLLNFPEPSDDNLVVAIVFQDGTVEMHLSTQGEDYPLNWGDQTMSRVMGKVFDENGEPAMGVELNIGDSVRFTNSLGVFVFPDAPVFENYGVINATKNGYFPACRSFVPKSDGNIVEIRLLPINTLTSFNAVTGAQLNLAGVDVNFQPNSIVFSNGTPYTGEVLVSLHNLNPSSEEFATEMPGNLTGSRNSLHRVLSPVGMMAISLFSSNGNALQLAEGLPATVVYPIPVGSISSAPLTIPIWAFDEDAGYWKYEGQAVKNANTYVAELSHFSFWSWSIDYDVIYIEGAVKDQNGLPVAESSVLFGVNTFPGGYDITTSAGLFSAYLPTDVLLDLNISFHCGSDPHFSLYSGTTGPYTTNTLLAEIIIPIPPQINTITGTISDCDNQPLVSGFLEINGLTFFTDQGNFTARICGNNANIITVKPEPILEFGDSLNINITQNNTDLGDIVLCNGDTLQTGTVTDIDNHVYSTVLIGNQWWMSENLRTTRYSDGTLIPNVTSGWETSITPGWVFYNHNPDLDTVYGKYYNWFTVATSQNVCPTDWHVPTYEEYLILINNAGGYLTAGGKMKTIEVPPAYPSWAQPNLGGSNLTGFSALAAGAKAYEEIFFSGEYYQASIWTVSNIDTLLARSIYIGYDTRWVTFFDMDKNSGLSIRCVKD